MPALEISLTPTFDDSAKGQEIAVSMTWNSPAKQKDDILLHHLLDRSGVPTAQYTADTVSVCDTTSQAPVGLYTDDKRIRNFHTSKDIPTGKLRATYGTSPRYVDEFTKCGPQIAVEGEDSGMSGAGMAFLLRPASDEVFDISISWDLSRAPVGTRAVCSLGEGNVFTRAKATVLDEVFFAVGAVKSYPPAPTSSSFGFYWLDEPGFDAVDLGKQLEVIVPRTMAFFNDTNPSFRIFARRNTQKCASGRGCHRGFVFAWNRIVPRPVDGVEEFVFHEIVHNWPLLGFLTGGPEDLADGWWNEGIAEYYSLVLPLRFGILSEEEFVDRLNLKISGYYTNPDRATLNRDVQAGFWKPGLVNQIPYQRGFMYFLRLTHQLKSVGKRSLDEPVLEMLRLRLAGEAHHIKTWLTLIETELGSAALKDYETMSNAQLIVLPEDCLDAVIEDSKTEWRLQREDQEEFYLGFPMSCLTSSPRVVKDLDPESRAAQAGVREGDHITQKYSYLTDAEKWNKKFWMIVKREEGEVEMSWWPRAQKKVESYQFAAVQTRIEIA